MNLSAVDDRKQRTDYQKWSFFDFKLKQKRKHMIGHTNKFCVSMRAVTVNHWNFCYRQNKDYHRQIALNLSEWDKTLSQNFKSILWSFYKRYSL